MKVMFLLRQCRYIGVATAAAIISLAANGRADWDPSTPNTKWLQNPDLTTTGMDVFVISPTILADDFQCNLTGPITDIHIWGSWLNNVGFGAITNIHISIHADKADPDGPGPLYSMPGDELWSTNFFAGQFIETFWATANEVFYNPNTGLPMGPDTLVWQYNMFIDPANAFVQTNGTVYWLDVQAFATNGLFGWKTSQEHWNDDAVWGDTTDLVWSELRYPEGSPLVGESVDLAFALTTVPEPSALHLMLLALAGSALFHGWRRRHS